MIGKNLIYSLTTRNGLPAICYDLGNKILFEDISEIKIELPTEIVTLKKSYYLNTQYRKKLVIYDNSNVFFAICTKHVRTDYVFKELLNYACGKIENRISKLENLKNSYKKLVAA